MADDDANREEMREKAADSDLSVPETPDISKFLTMSDFRVDFVKRRHAVFTVIGFLSVLAVAAYAVPLWGIYRAIERSQPVDPTIGNIVSGLNTAIFINIAAIIGGYLIVPAWESSNFRKNFGDVMKTLTNSNTQRTAMRYQNAKKDD